MSLFVYMPGYRRILTYICLYICTYTHNSMNLSFIYSFFHSFTYSILKHVRSLFRSKFKQSAIYCFLFQFQVPCLLLKAVQYLLRLSLRLTLTYNFISIFPSMTCFIKQFLRKMRPIHSEFLLFIVSRINI